MTVCLEYKKKSTKKKHEIAAFSILPQAKSSVKKKMTSFFPQSQEKIEEN